MITRRLPQYARSLQMGQVIPASPRSRSTAVLLGLGRADSYSAGSLEAPTHAGGRSVICIVLHKAALTSRAPSRYGPQADLRPDFLAATERGDLRRPTSLADARL
jgi:hypothetical protein